MRQKIAGKSGLFTSLSLVALGLLFAHQPAVAQQLYASVESLPNAPMPQQQAAAQQGTASITGIIADIADGFVPGANVILLGEDKTTIVAETKSVDEGRFEFKDIAPGTYSIKVTATGLESFLSNPITLKADEHFELPTTALPIATANQSVDVVLTQSQIADQELAEETKQRVLGVLPNFYTSYQWNAAPLNTKQKMKLALKARSDPTVFVTTAIVAGIEQYRNTFPGYGDDAAAYGKRYGAAFGDSFIGRFIGSAVLPSIFRQDPRYFYMGPQSTKAQRFRHAIAFSVTARGDNGKLQPNYSHLLGNFIAGYISKTYHPDSDKGITLALDNALIGIGGSAVQGLVREFIYRSISTHTPKYANGRAQAESTPAAAKP